jgi:hypothetical protein
VVSGKRWVLQKQGLNCSKPFPSRGRVTARHGDSSAEALLELPAAETKSKDGLDAIPASLWVTIGLLAQDGFALQVRLRRTAKPSERDKATGTWHVYHAVGGAITLLESIKKPEAAAQPKVQALKAAPGELHKSQAQPETELETAAQSKAQTMHATVQAAPCKSQAMYEMD